jgi:hypothetical protein
MLRSLTCDGLTGVMFVAYNDVSGSNRLAQPCSIPRLGFNRRARDVQLQQALLQTIRTLVDSHAQCNNPEALRLTLLGFALPADKLAWPDDHSH